MVSIHIMQVEICILFVTWPHKTTPLDVMHIYWWKLHATTLKSLVIIGILIVKRKNASSKTRIFSLSNSRRHLANADMKSKIILSRRQFFADVIFLPLRKFRTIKIKLEKNSYTQTNVCLLHISRNFKDIFKYICFTFYLQQTVNHWESAIIFIDRCCLPFFFQQTLDPISLEKIWSYNDLASIPRHCCSVSYINSVPQMRISGNVFDVFECTSPCHLLN